MAGAILERERDRERERERGRQREILHARAVHSNFTWQNKNSSAGPVGMDVLKEHCFFGLPS